MHKVTYALGIAGDMVVCCTMFGVNLMFAIKPDTAMEFAVAVLFYGLCADKIASKLGVSTCSYNCCFHQNDYMSYISTKQVGGV